MAITVSGFGLTLIDTLVVINKNIEDISKNTKIVIDKGFIQQGGVVPTALMTLSRFNIGCEMIGIVGDDIHGDLVLDLLEKEKVDTKKIIKIQDGETPIALILIEPKTGERTIFNNKGCFLKAGMEYKVNLANSSRFLFLDGHNFDLASSYINQARKRGTKILLDAGSPKKNIEKLIEKADVAFFPEGYWSKKWPGKSPFEITRLLSQESSLIVALTMGKKGSFIGFNSKVFYQPAFKVKALDTNAAGDVFMGAFGYGLIRRWRLEQVSKFASAAAAISCKKIGKKDSIPESVDVVKKFLKTAKLEKKYY